MSTIIDTYKRRKLSPRGQKLLLEWEGIDKLCNGNTRISYIKKKFNQEDLPIEYEIIYKVRSIIGVKEPVEVTKEINGQKLVKTVREPIYGKEHHMKIILPNNYPSCLGNPQFNFITDIWHPNIKSSGQGKGRVCVNEKDTGVTASLASRILRIGKYLQYQDYFALNNYPYPEDIAVAQWVIEEAEFMGWVNKDEGNFTDYFDLMEREEKMERPVKNGEVIVLPSGLSLKAAGASHNSLKI